MMYRYKKILPVIISAATITACNSGTSQSGYVPAPSVTQTAYVADNGLDVYNGQSLHDAPTGLPNVYQYAKIDGKFIYVESIA